jgi:tetratricopeptide (TPR) repeat protein
MDLSNIQRNLRNLDDALIGHVKVIEIYQKFFGENHEEYAKSLGNLANVYKDLEEFETAKEYEE